MSLEVSQLVSFHVRRNWYFISEKILWQDLNVGVINNGLWIGSKGVQEEVSH